MGLYFSLPNYRFSRQDSCSYFPCEKMDTHGTAACDFDCDGDWDLYVAVGAKRGRGIGPNQFWQQSNSGRYDNTLDAGSFMADAHGRGRGAVWLRLDEDPYPELLVLNYKSPALLFHFDGKEWSDWSGRLPPPAPRSGTSGRTLPGKKYWFATAAVGDLDGDGRTDLFLGGDQYLLLRNTGAGNLEDVTVRAGLPDRGRLMIQALMGDVDNDGDLDLLFANRWVGGLHIWMNESVPGKIKFRAGPSLDHLSLASEIDSAWLADLDNDGLLDLYVMLQERGGDNLPNLLARGLGNGDFEDVSGQWGGRGLVESLPSGFWPVDLDRDGDLELMLVHGKENHPDRKGVCVLYKNQATNRGLTLVLAQGKGAPHGLGSQVVLHARFGSQYRQVHSAVSHFNSTVLPLHFGLGGDPGPYQVEVTWPDGERWEYVLPHAGTSYLLLAQEGVVVELD